MSIVNVHYTKIYIIMTVDDVCKKCGFETKNTEVCLLWIGPLIRFILTVYIVNNNVYLKKRRYVYCEYEY